MVFPTAPDIWEHLENLKKLSNWTSGRLTESQLEDIVYRAYYNGCVDTLNKNLLRDKSNDIDIEGASRYYARKLMREIIQNE